MQAVSKLIANLFARHGVTDFPPIAAGILLNKVPPARSNNLHNLANDFRFFVLGARSRIFFQEHVNNDTEATISDRVEAFFTSSAYYRVVVWHEIGRKFRFVYLVVDSANFAWGAVAVHTLIPVVLKFLVRIVFVLILFLWNAHPDL